MAVLDAIHEARDAAVRETARAELAARNAALGAKALEGKVIAGSGKVHRSKHCEPLPVSPIDHHD